MSEYTVDRVALARVIDRLRELGLSEGWDSSAWQSVADIVAEAGNTMWMTTGALVAEIAVQAYHLRGQCAVEQGEVTVHQYTTKLHDLLEAELLTRQGEFQQVITETLTVIVSVVMTLAPQAGAELTELWLQARTRVLLASQDLLGRQTTPPVDGTPG